jgi:hypothetical protein
MPASVADKDAAGRSGASGPVILETKLAQPRFVYAVAALRTVEPEIGTHALAAHGTPGAGLVEVVLPSCARASFASATRKRTRFSTELAGREMRMRRGRELAPWVRFHSCARIAPCCSVTAT